jgi:hypothetical protein
MNETASGVAGRSGRRSGQGGKKNTRAPRRKGLGLLLGAVAALALLAVGAAVAIDHAGFMPRTLAPYIEHRSSGHNPAISGLGRFASRTLVQLDRGTPVDTAALPVTLGAQERPAGADARGGVLVASADELRAALGKADAGDTITLLPGTYRFNGAALDASRPGREDAPITVRAARPGSVQLELDMVEGFRVSAPYWRFENLSIRGVCGDDGACEHAFHVIGAASHFVARNNTLADFNAHFKINGAGGRFPDDGLIEANTLFDSHPRRTGNPVTPIDLVAASRWVIRANVIRDFIKADGDRVSYGAFAKGGGSGTLFERNLVWCEQSLANQPGQRVGLSLGGGATGPQYCRDKRCITEQDGGIVRANLILACSDAGLYLNSAAASRVEDNTLLDTAGIDVRFATSSATLDGNLVDGPIRSRDGGLLHLGDNHSTPVWESFVGLHPVRNLFADPASGDLRWRDGAPVLDAARPGADLCGGKRAQGAYGAFDDFSACLLKP